MNQYFSFSRFGRLVRKHFFEHGASYALSAAVLLGILLAITLFLSYMGRGIGAQGQSILYLLGLLAAGSLFTSSVLAGYGQGSGAALALTLPASQLEKFVLAWLLSVPGLLVVFTGVFYLSLWLALTLTHRADMLANVFDNRDMMEVTLVWFGLLHAGFLWGSIGFRRQQFIRTGFGLFAVAVAVGVLNYQAVRLLLGAKLGAALPFGHANLHQGLNVSLPDSQTGWVSLVPMALVALLWLAAYARLTEKQL